MFRGCWSAGDTDRYIKDFVCFSMLPDQRWGGSVAERRRNCHIHVHNCCGVGSCNLSKSYMKISDSTVRKQSREQALPSAELTGYHNYPFPLIDESFELVLSHSFPHCTCRADTALHHLETFVDIICTTPLLMLNDIDPILHFGFLDQFAICPHTIFGKRLAELMAYERSSM